MFESQVYSRRLDTCRNRNDQIDSSVRNKGSNVRMIHVCVHVYHNHINISTYFVTPFNKLKTSFKDMLAGSVRECMCRDMRVQILIWFETFCSSQNPIFRLFMHGIQIISYFFRPILTDALTPLHVVTNSNYFKWTNSWNHHELKSLFPKRVKSTFGTSEKNRFLWQNLYTCLWENKIYIEKKMYLRELSRSKFHSVTSSNVILYNDAKNSIFLKSGFSTFWKWALQLQLWWS